MSPSWIPTIVMMLSALATVFSTELQNLVAAHPAIAAALAGLAGIVTHHLPSPTVPPNPPPT